MTSAPENGLPLMLGARRRLNLIDIIVCSGVLQTQQETYNSSRLLMGWSWMNLTMLLTGWKFGRMMTMLTIVHAVWYKDN